MELEFNNDRRKSRLLMGFGLVLALVAGMGAYYAMSQARASVAATGAGPVPVVVAVTPIKAREPIKEDQVKVQEFALDPAAATGIATDLGQVVGRVPVAFIPPGQLITTNLFAASSSAQFSILQPDETIAPDSEHWRAIAITAPDDLAVGGSLEAGQTVDILVTAVVNVTEDAADTGRYYTDRATKVVYQNALILSRNDAFYIIRVSLAIAEEIAYLQSTGSAQFILVLRPDVDTRVANATDLGQTLNRIIKRYGLPFPETLDALGGRPRPPAPSPSPSPGSSSAPSAAPDASQPPDASPSPAP
jgi:Flp pilus assembly protein CpaB